mgnify:FL=1
MHAQEILSVEHCDLTDTLIADRSVREILSLDDENKSEICVRITDESNLLSCKKGIIRNYKRIMVLLATDLSYNFNTGRCREIVVSHRKNVNADSYSITFLVYEYGCDEVITDVYSITYLLAYSEDSSLRIMSKSYGDVDL